MALSLVSPLNTIVPGACGEPQCKRGKPGKLFPLRGSARQTRYNWGPRAHCFNFKVERNSPGPSHLGVGQPEKQIIIGKVWSSSIYVRGVKRLWRRPALPTRQSRSPPLSSLHKARRALVLVALTGLSAVGGGAAPETKPTAAQIDRWIEQLGDGEFWVREEASRRLWAAGETAEAALKKAADSSDAEVARRAREVLEKFKWGLYPDTPKDVADLIASYQGTTDASQKVELIGKLLRAGLPGRKAMLKISSAEDNAEVRALIFGKVSKELPLLLAEDNLEAVEALVEAGIHTEALGPAPYAAYWLLRGKLDERIASFEAIAKEGKQKRAAEVLVYLYRARGDLAAARTAAMRARSRDLSEAMLFEAADWNGLAKLPELANGDTPLERAGLRSAFHRLAGNAKEADAALAEARSLAEKDTDGFAAAFQGAKIFFLNDRPAEAMDLLTRAERLPMRYEVLVTRMEHDRAAALVEEARTAGSKDLPALELLQARTWFVLGEKDKMKAILSRHAEQIKEGFDPQAVAALLETEHRLGLHDDAFAHCARALALHKADGPANVRVQPLLARVFPEQADTAIVWWTLLRQKYPAEPSARVFERVRSVLQGKAKVEEVRDWIKEAEAGVVGLEAEMVLAARAEAARVVGDKTLARSCLEKATRPANLVRLGDWLAEDRRWTEAAASYLQAWDKDRREPLPLFLSGWALNRAGKNEEGRKRMEKAHWLPLADEAGRYAFMQELSKRGQSKALRREADLLRRVSRVESFYFGAALRQVAVDAAARKAYLEAAQAYEQAMLRCLRPYTNFVQAGAYVGVPALVHRLRAIGLLEHEKLDAARREAELAYAAQPGHLDTAILLVPAFERRGMNKEANRLFDDTLAIYEKVCKDHPQSAWGHNSVAWLSACCRRNLDGALAHAEKAVALTPGNPSHLDTLAEVHFQRGNRARAIELQKQVVELGPKKPYYRRQLKRIEAGDPKADRPPEDEDE